MQVTQPLRPASSADSLQVCSARTLHTVPLPPIKSFIFDDIQLRDYGTGEPYGIMWTGQKDDAFFILQGDPATGLTITYQEGGATRRRPAKVDDALKNWQATTVLLANFISGNSDALGEWFTSSSLFGPSPFARLIEATAVGQKSGSYGLNGSWTSQDDFNDRFLQLSTDTRLTGPGYREIIRRRRLVFRERKEARHRARQRIKTLLKAYDIRYGVVKVVKPLSPDKIRETLRIAQEDFHVGYHYWRRYGDIRAPLPRLPREWR